MKTLPVFRATGALLLAVLLLNDAHSAEIRLKSGRTFEGTVKHITPQTVVVETGNQVLFLSADLVEMSPKDWLATAQTAFEQDNIENAAILCRHALGKSKDLEEARDLMRKIEEKRIRKERETAIRATQALAERQRALAAPPAPETAPATPAVVPPLAGENPIEGAAPTPSVSGDPNASAGLTSAGLGVAEPGPPAPGSLGAGFRLEGPGTVPTPSGGAGSAGGEALIPAGLFPPGFGALAAFQMAAGAAFRLPRGQSGDIFPQVEGQHQPLGPGEKHELLMSLDDRFMVADTEKWRVIVEKELAIRFANVKVEPKKDNSFSLMLNFMCDTPDLANFDSPEKMERGVLSTSSKFLSKAVEKKIELKKLNPKGWYGCYTVLTDAGIASEKTKISKDEFRYFTVGMVRLSKDSALGFTLLTNDLDSPQYKEVFDYILSFVKAKQ